MDSVCLFGLIHYFGKELGGESEFQGYLVEFRDMALGVV